MAAAAFAAGTWIWRLGLRRRRGDGAGRAAETSPAGAEALLAARAAERRAQALVRLGELSQRLRDAAARCDAYLDGEADDIGPAEPAWRPYAEAGAVALGDDREAYVVVAAACRGMETVAAEPAPERVEPVRRMIAQALRALERVLS